MSDFYPRMAETTLKQIADKGRTIKLVTPGNDVYVPGTGFTPGTPTEQTPKAVFVDYKAQDVDGTIIRADDKQCLIAASSLTGEPTTADKVKEGSTEWAVVKVEVIKPGDTALLYRLQVRR